MEKYICVYSSASETISSKYKKVGVELGEMIAINGYGMIYGGGATGLMGTLSRTVHKYKGKVIGVIPEKLNRKGIVYDNCDELIVTKNMRDRKKIMEEGSNAFIALPGGFGTLEELLEIITLKQLGYHNKPIVVINHEGFYDCMLSQFDLFYDENFVKNHNRDLFCMVKSPKEAMNHIQNFIVK